jgi:hypothetical protein
MSHQIHTYTELRQQIHDDLRIQHPEWVQPNGECPECDFYEARLIEELDTLTRRRSNKSIGTPIVRFANDVETSDAAPSADDTHPPRFETSDAQAY